MLPFGGPCQGRPVSISLVNAFISTVIVSTIVSSDVESNDSRDEHPKKRLRMSQPYGPRPDYMNSKWGKMITYDKDRMLASPICRESRNFRRRFRVPPRMFFDVLVPQNIPVFEPTDESDIYRNRIPVELKVLVVLRILGRDACADDCSELSDISESS